MQQAQHLSHPPSQLSNEDGRLFVSTQLTHLTSHWGQLSLAILQWVAMPTIREQAAHFTTQWPPV